MPMELGTIDLFYFFIPIVVIVVGLYLLFIHKRRCASCGRPIRPIWRECPCASKPSLVFSEEPAPQVPKDKEPVTQRLEAHREMKLALEPERKPFSFDDAEPLFGSQTAARTEVIPPSISSAWLEIEELGKPEKRFAIRGKVISIGSSNDNDLVIKDRTVSRHHAKIRIERQKYFIYDLASTNGTRVNGRKAAKKWIKEGDNIEMGHARMTFRTGAPTEEIAEHKPSDLLKM
jgi:hypothetical protein